MYEVLLKAAEQNDADYVYCNYSFYPKAVTTKAKWFKPYKGKLDWNLIERNTQPWNKLIRRDLAERIHMADLLPEQRQRLCRSIDPCKENSMCRSRII